MKRTRIRSVSDKRRARMRAWVDVRRQVHDRALGVCEIRTDQCARYGVHAHHVLRRSQGGSDDLGNLLWCCEPCHAYAHAHPAESFERGWMRRP